MTDQSGDAENLAIARETIEILQAALDRSAGARIPADEAKPPLYDRVWTDRGAMVWDGSIWRKPFDEGPNIPRSVSRWELRREARKPRQPDPVWWLRERR